MINQFYSLGLFVTVLYVLLIGRALFWWEGFGFESCLIPVRFRVLEYHYFCIGWELIYPLA